MDIKSMIDEYMDFLKQNISYRQIEKGYEITTPFLDDNNDCIQIYVDDINGENIKLSDDGTTISNLLMGGLKLTQTRKQLLYSIVSSYGVELENNNLTIECKVKDFPSKKHALLQAMLKVGDMSYTSQSRVASMFSEDVAEYFKSYNIPNIQDISVVGKSGFLHTYDFVLARDANFCERFCNAINRPTKTTVFNTIFGWQDTLPQRKRKGNDGELCVFLNDDNKYSPKYEDAFGEYGIITIRKSKMTEKESLKNFKVS